MKYKFDEYIDRRNTYSTQWDYAVDRFGRDDVLPFSISDTDFRAPVEVQERLSELIDLGIYGYSRWRHNDYFDAINNYYTKRHNTDIRDYTIVYSPSVMYSISMLIQLLSEENDAVLSFTPMYDAFFKVVENNKRQLISPKLKATTSNYEVDWANFESLLKDAKIFLLCSPHNPTGKVWTSQELANMVSLCKKYNVWIISDEIHSDIIHHGYHTPILSDQFDYNQIILVSSASKTFNIPSLGGSYAIFKDHKLSEAFNDITRNRDFVNSPSLFGMHALIVSYTQSLDYIDELNTYVYDNYKYIKQAFKKMFAHKITFYELESTYLVWFSVDNFEMSPQKIYQVLVDEAKVGIMQGQHYGDETFMRLNIGCSRKKLEELVHRVNGVKDLIY